MLPGSEPTAFEVAERERLLGVCAEPLQELQQRFGLHAVSVLTGLEPLTITYPVLRYPEKVASLELEKDSELAGTLLGIKGQYLILDSGVLNIRKYTGYELELTILD